MNLAEFKVMVDRAVNSVERMHQKPEDINVGIKVFNPNKAGSSATVDIKSLSHGFDWNKNKVIIYPETELSSVFFPTN
jgi:hypothetical protein